MTKFAIVAALPLVLLLAAGMQTQVQVQKSDEDANLAGIRKTALDYGQGWYEGDAERMERALHPDLAKRVLRPDPRSGRGTIDHMSAMSLVQATRKGYGTKIAPDRRRTEVTILEVYGNAACVKLQMHDWVDFMHMSKIGGEWKIVNVLWEFTPEAKKKYGIPDEL